MPLTEAQIDALSITERVVSVLSILGILFILTTFFFLKSFHKPINRLICFASFGNLGMNIACLVAEDGIAHGSTSSLCTFQAFLIQMYLPLNIRHLKQALTALSQVPRCGRLLGLLYGLECIPRLFPQLWCWIDIKWDFLRIALLYGIVWIAIFFAFAIYIKAGLVIYHRRDQLKGFLNPLNDHPFTGIVTTSIDITVENITSPGSSSHPRPLNNYFDQEFDRYTGRHPNNHDPSPTSCPYAVTIAGPPALPPVRPEILRMRSLTREEALRESPNPGAWLYARVAFLFFLGMLVIWIPSSVNRVYALAHPTRVNFALNYVSALVLPAQGCVNVVVYVITSRTACGRLWGAVRGREGVPWRVEQRTGDEDAEELVGMEKGVRESRSDGKLSGKGSVVSVPVFARMQK
ncbi:MAG: hypothetical protein Q9197_001852 [Variospora fuerteventurae]